MTNTSYLDIPKKHIVRVNLKRLSEFYGGEDAEFLKYYTDDLVNKDLDEAVKCTISLIKDMEALQVHGCIGGKLDKQKQNLQD